MILSAQAPKPVDQDRSLKEQEVGTPVAELCRKHGRSDAPFYTWKSKYGRRERLPHLVT